MVGIVIVSHSKALADSLLAMAREVSDKDVPIAAAGGVDDPDHPFGTDAMKILEAIQEVYTPDGVVVFMDLGSAILSTETALDFLDDGQKENVWLSHAPLVEGVASAVVQAGADLPIDEVFKESAASLRPKEDQLGVSAEPDDQPDEPAVQSGDSEDTIQASFTLKNTLGIHARPASRIVRALSGLDADLRIRNRSKKNEFVKGKSLNSLMMLDARQGDEVELSLSGSQSGEAMKKLEEMFRNHFGESTDPPAEEKQPEVQKSDSDEPILEGRIVSGGLAIGPAVHFKGGLPEIEKREAQDPDQEIRRLTEAIKQSKREIESIIEKHRGVRTDEEIGIFEAQLVMLEDPDLFTKTEAIIRNSSLSAPYAWRTTVAQTVEQFDHATSDAIRMRGNDLLDVGIRVLKHLSDDSPFSLDLHEPSVLLADQLHPSDVTSIETDKIRAICTAKGTETSHSAILSRGLGIPVLFGLGPSLLDVPGGRIVAVDAEGGLFYKEPDEDELKTLKSRLDEYRSRRDAAFKKKNQPVVLPEGDQLQIMANISSVDDARHAVDSGAEGSGLFRTEFLYMNSDQPPSGEQQFGIYKSVAETFGDRPVAVRTADIGGDKPLPYLEMGEELNPYLGWRGIRFSLDDKELFQTQITAILKASAFGNLSIMLPMVSTPSEIIRAKRIIQNCKHELSAEETTFNRQIKIGVMIEVPAAVFTLEKIFGHVDFISIGTNDLSQYVMAADRNNSRVSELGSYYQPAVLHALRQIIHTANNYPVPVSICGEMAGDQLVTPLLLQMGLRRFSITAAEIPLFKHYLREIASRDYRELTDVIDVCDDTDEVKERLETFRE